MQRAGGAGSVVVVVAVGVLCGGRPSPSVLCCRVLLRGLDPPECCAALAHRGGHTASGTAGKAGGRGVWAAASSVPPAAKDTSATRNLTALSMDTQNTVITLKLGEAARSSHVAN